MSVRKISFFTCVTLSLLCLTAGYAMAGKWTAALVAMITGLAWMPARKHPDSGLPFICLSGSVVLAVVGTLNGSLPFLMICGTVFGLAAWDLIFLERALGTRSLADQTGRFEKRHLRTLAQVLGFGLTAALAGRLLNFQTPFFVMMLLVAVVIFGFERIWSIFNKRNIH